MHSTAKTRSDPNTDTTPDILLITADTETQNSYPSARHSFFTRACNYIFAWQYRKGNPKSSAIIGTPSALNRIQYRRELYCEGKIRPVFFPITEPQTADWPSTIDHVEKMMTASHIDRLIVALPLPGNRHAEAMLDRLIAAGGPISLVDTAAEHASDNDGRSLKPMRGMQMVAKSVIDRAGAAILLAVLSPLLLIVAASIGLTSPGPVFFVQPRLGRHNRVIPVIKFRTMYADRGDRSGGCATTPNDPRVTKLGRILRRWSIDELPQLFNVLIGQMSLVGPRPHAVMMKAGDRLYFDALPAYLSRHSVKPGITGWAQVNRLSGLVNSVAGGRARLLYDLDYIENWSLWLDLKIFVMTTAVFFDRVNRY